VSTRGEGGFDGDHDVAWRKDGVFVLSTEVMFGDKKYMCDWQPDTLQLRLPIAKGTSWESTSSCMVSGLGPTPVQVKRTLTASVVELRRTRVGGQVVDVWAIDGTDKIEVAGGVIDRVGTTLFSPKHGIVVGSSGTVKFTGSEGSREGPYSTELLSLDPA
jgi:hypothetical protein